MWKVRVLVLVMQSQFYSRIHESKITAKWTLYSPKCCSWWNAAQSTMIRLDWERGRERESYYFKQCCAAANAFKMDMRMDCSHDTCQKLLINTVNLLLHAKFATNRQMKRSILIWNVCPLFWIELNCTNWRSHTGIDGDMMDSMWNQKTVSCPFQSV